ncbi:GIY-YIG nuclease family protein [Arhodomonas aquaeolei]|uniref:GIY-YIG nuclease family protein n=1 Tax=Arhodomonas aquaeolei TaxID=2369 RepID=UPI00216947A4|nr:GIY-YIG nuclease family protein [Arhodomonas aquaeolei]MCS4504286.1 GIY-YIG nuclease family protein [Arhodomonas aquaeolei]
MEMLTALGFGRIGAWEIGPQGLRLHLERMGDDAPALYAFVVAGAVMYIGKTTRPLRRRLYGYLRPGETQRTNVRVRGLILDAFQDGKAVETLGFSDKREQRLATFRLNLPAALEDDLIKQLSPPWNGGKADRTANPEPEDRLAIDNSPASAPVQSLGQAPTLTHSDQKQPAFTVRIGRTYHDQGFFNVPVKHAGN